MLTQSLGIIGGADGPTVIFVTGKGSLPLLIVGGIALAALIVGCVILIRKRKRKG